MVRLLADHLQGQVDRTVCLGLVVLVDGDQQIIAFDRVQARRAAVTAAHQNVVLYSEFDSQEALAAYATHPEHLRVKRELGDCRIARHQVDYVATV
ncbi:Dabb family protein [Pseudomonas yamanorum]|nr:Dabb family protein [Pseudomonas yamanorum]